MFQIDYLPVESDTGAAKKSGDAIAGRLWLPDGTCRVFVVDGGYTAVGDDLVEHIERYYDTTTVDLLVSTHPDADHLNGLLTVLKNATVGEVLIHRPRDHMAPGDAEYFPNIERVDEVIAAAEDRDIPVVEPFTGLTRWGGQLRVLGPTRTYYTDLIDQAIADERSGAARRERQAKALRAAVGSQWDAYSLVPMATLPEETLVEHPEGTSHRNNTSTVIAISDGTRRALLTGDAGVPALEAATAQYETHFGTVTDTLTHLQVPHHGSRRNVSPALLDRLVGPRGGVSRASAVVSSALADPKHPSPKVTNAFLRRGVHVVATEGDTVMVHHDCPRPGWSQMPSIGPREETD